MRFATGHNDIPSRDEVVSAAGGPAERSQAQYRGRRSPTANSQPVRVQAVLGGGHGGGRG